MLWEALLLAILGGVFVGLSLIIFGGGGSVLATPWLIYVVGISDTHEAIGTSAAAVTINAIIGLRAQAKAGRVKWPCSIIFGIFGLIGALLGAYIGKQVDGGMLIKYFAILMIVIAIFMMLPTKILGDPNVSIQKHMIPKLAPLGSIAGTAAGFFGIGGGFLIAPGLMAATGMTFANASASSLLSVSVFGGATSLSYAASGQLLWFILAALIFGGSIGTVLAIPISKKITANNVIAQRSFAMMVIVVAICLHIRND